MRVADRIDTRALQASTYSSAAFGLDHLEGYSITIKGTETTATLAGTLKLQASNNAFQDNVNLSELSDAVWVDVTGSSQAVSGSGTFMWNTSEAYYRAVRWVWTRASGTGTFVAYIHAKGPQS